jgi:hypothetical protein
MIVHLATDPSKFATNEAQGYCSSGVCGVGTAQGRASAIALASGVGLTVEQPAAQTMAITIARLKM